MRLNSADIFIPKPSSKYSKEDIAEMQRAKDELTNAGDAFKATATNAYEAKQLQPDTLVLSEEAQQKAAEETKGKDFMALSSADEPAKDIKEQEKSLKEAISKLTMEIMEISMQLGQLKAKDDEKSLKESQSLENELALKKAMLDAKVSQQLELAKLS